MTKVALVTGAARGIGLATTDLLLERGWQVAMVDRDGDELMAAAGQLQGVHPIIADVSIPRQVDRMRDEALARFGRIDALVNSAGHGPRGDCLALSPQDWHAALDVYFLSAIRPIRAALPHLGDGASIVNITSYVAADPSPAFPTSSAMRAALHAWVKLAADQLGTRGIRINNIAPGFIDSIPQPAERLAGAAIPRQGTVAEIAATAAFLLSDAASYITGQTLRVDGGLGRGL